jgi:superoxide dismutase, Fe-Mn family
MSDVKKLEELLTTVDLKSIVKKSVRDATPGIVKEALVAQPKPYKMVSEFTSQRTKDSHRGLYEEYVKTFNRVSAELDAVDRKEADGKHSEFRSLKLDETYNLNGIYLHELYFANAFDPHSEITMDSIAFMELSNAFGDFNAWQRDFIACAMSCGNGWAVTGFNCFTKSILNTMVSNNSQDVQAGLLPLIVLDLVEHSFYLDYLSDRKSYVISQLRQLNWVVIEERFNKMKSVREILR